MCFFVWHLSLGQSLEKNTPPPNPQIPFKASVIPDRIILSFGDQVDSQRNIKWRTSLASDKQALELAVQTGKSDFHRSRLKFSAQTALQVTLQSDSSLVHEVSLIDLEKNKIYSYRVGGGDYWSPWFDFDTQEPEDSFQFIFLGDAQNDLVPLWSRVVAKAFETAPKAKFALHVGDLINHSQNDYEWAEWFHAASPYIQRIPQLIVPGNHEYIKDENEKKIGITPYWDAHFKFPANGPINLKNRSYFYDYGNSRFIMLDSNEKLEEQADWLENILASNTQKWVIVMFHHPVISGATGRVNDGVLKIWKPILDKYKVDLVLQGHDHVYARGNEVISGLDQWNEYSGTVYVVAVAGRKMYPLGDHPWMLQKFEGVQTFQTVTVFSDMLKFETYMSNGELLDAFEIIKEENSKNTINELILGN